MPPLTSPSPEAESAGDPASTTSSSSALQLSLEEFPQGRNFAVVIAVPQKANPNRRRLVQARDIENYERKSKRAVVELSDSDTHRVENENRSKKTKVMREPGAPKPSGKTPRESRAFSATLAKAEEAQAPLFAASPTLSSDEGGQTKIKAEEGMAMEVRSAVPKAISEAPQSGLPSRASSRPGANPSSDEIKNHFGVPSGLFKTRDQIDAAPPGLQRLLFFRSYVNRRMQMYKTEPSLAPEVFTSLKKMLSDLAFYPLTEEYMRESQILWCVWKLRSARKWSDTISEMASQLFDRWYAKNLEPGRLEGDDLDLLSDESDSEEDAGVSTTRTYGEFVRQLMRGVNRKQGEKKITYSLGDNPRRRADVFGHNGLTHGDWWPYRVCALRDGAHGHMMAGIYGTIDQGAYAIVTSTSSEYADMDRGDILYYSGSAGDPSPRDGSTDAILTNHTKTLLISRSRGKPVRVLRNGPGGEWGPKVGLRYDGLYKVADGQIVSPGNGKRRFYRFKLERLPGQPPLESLRNRPNGREIAAYEELRG